MDKINSVTLANKVPTPMTRAPFTHFGGGGFSPLSPPAYADSASTSEGVPCNNPNPKPNPNPNPNPNVKHYM